MLLSQPVMRQIVKITKTRPENFLGFQNSGTDIRRMSSMTIRRECNLLFFILKIKIQINIRCLNSATKTKCQIVQFYCIYLCLCEAKPCRDDTLRREYTETEYLCISNHVQDITQLVQEQDLDM